MAEGGLNGVAEAGARRPAPRSNLVLCGFMASGKSTVGRVISGESGMPLVDTDVLVEREAGMPVKDIFDSRGEPAFREMERKVIARESGRGGAVLAVGGGAVLDPRNTSALRSTGVIYHLDVSPEEVDRRATDGERPLLPPGIEGIRSLMETRRRAYLEAADVTVRTDARAPEDIAREVLADFRSRSGGQ